MARSFWSKAAFNAAFLIVNLMILVTNLSLVGRNKPQADSNLQEIAPRRMNSPSVVGPVSVSVQAGVEEGKLGAAPAERRLQQERRPVQQDRHNLERVPANKTQGIVSTVWDKDWDNRHAAAVLRGLSQGPLRRLWLVRHGDYHREGAKQGHLTDIGKAQVEKTGKRLKDFGIHFDSFVSSTSIRARESAEILSRYLPNSRVEWSDLLKEGQPGYPEPAFAYDVPKSKIFQDDLVRLEMGFKKFIHRADVDKKGTTNDLIVAHGNVIGYFTLRGLQVPAERWLKVQVIQGSISMYEITYDSQFNVRILGDMGHIPVSDWTG